MSAVDVRDVASAHLKALGIKAEKPSQVEEFILSAGVEEGWTWNGVADFVRKKYPSVDVQLNGPFDKPPTVDTQRAENILGMEWRKMEDTVSSLFDQQVELRSQL
jgi:nucleoside-diphosphate-sugar epimerase